MRLCEIFKVLVVSEDLDRKFHLFEPVSPILESLYDCERLLIRYSVVAFGWVHQFQHETNQVMLIICLFLGQDSSIGIIQCIGFHSELLIQISVHENRSLTNSPLQEFKGAMLIFSPLPGLVLLEEIM